MTPMNRRLALASLAVVLSAGGGCAEVHIEDRTDVETSSASGAGGGASTAATSPAGGGDGDGATTSGGEGGGDGEAGGPPAPVACANLAWSSPSSSPLQSTEQPGTVGHLAIAPLPADGAFLVAVSHVFREDDAVLGLGECRAIYDRELVGSSRSQVFVQTDVPPPLAFGRDGEPVVVAAEGPATADLVTLLPMAEVATTGVSVDLPRARGLAFDAAAGAYAVVHGPDAAPELTLVRHGEPATTLEVGRLACADRPVPVAVAPSGGGFLVASARSTTGSCDDGDAGPATVMHLEIVDAAGSRTTLGTSEGGAPVVDLELAADAGTAWLAVRREGADEVQLLPIGGGSLGGGVVLDARAGRGVTLTARGDGVAVLDTGPAIHGDAAVRVRLLDAGLGTRLDATPPGTFVATPEGAPVLHLSADGSRLDAVWFARRTSGQLELASIGADCLAGR